MWLLFLCDPAHFSLFHCLVFTTPVYEKVGWESWERDGGAAGRGENAEYASWGMPTNTVVCVKLNI